MLIPLIGAAALGGLVACGYQSMAPAGQWFGKTFTALPPGTKNLALTYDDGPNDPHTFRLLEVLAKYNVKATFFLIGRYVKIRPDIVRGIVQEGHTVGNHTYTHPNLIFVSRRETESELQRCTAVIEEAASVRVKLFRPPFGGRLPKTFCAAAAQQLDPIMWNVTGWDWNAPPADSIERKVAKQIRGGDVILLHDGGHKAMGADRSQSVLATDKLIERYTADGYNFVPVDTMRSLCDHRHRGTDG
jgi:peptidoglycan/xylan/chitin deacetylase (PgdA/CDA1 family)